MKIRRWKTVANQQVDRWRSGGGVQVKISSHVSGFTASSSYVMSRLCLFHESRQDVAPLSSESKFQSCRFGQFDH